ncbi:YezD family protein [Metabacillus sp. Hm71]|uniref:YezD family protein n=1 Tax=Metabacillus sp. Hm71 TaxID=3450743 RepID=UPI003F43ACFB
MASKTKIDQAVIDKIVSFLENIEYGTVQITVHDSQVTQIEKGEKYRFAMKKSNERLKNLNTN